MAGDRHTAQPLRRGEAAPPGPDGRTHRARALPNRGADHRRPLPSRHRPGLRLRRGGRPRLPDHGAGGQRPPLPGPARAGEAEPRPDPGLRVPGGQGTGRRARPRRGAPGHQTGQPAGDRGGAAQADRLRHRPRGHVRHPHPDRHGDGHGAVHLARAGVRPARERRLRPVRARRGGLRVPRRRASVHRRQPGGAGPGAHARRTSVASRGHPGRDRRPGLLHVGEGPREPPLLRRRGRASGRGHPLRRGDGTAHPVHRFLRHGADPGGRGRSRHRAAERIPGSTNRRSALRTR